LSPSEEDPIGYFLIFFPNFRGIYPGNVTVTIENKQYKNVCITTNQPY